LMILPSVVSTSERRANSTQLLPYDLSRITDAAAFLV
jgi:hypothetical protein